MIKCINKQKTILLNDINKNKIEYTKDIIFKDFRDIIVNKYFKCIYNKKNIIFTYDCNISCDTNKDIYLLSKQDFIQLLLDLYIDFIKQFCQHTRTNNKSVKTFNFFKFKIISPILFLLLIMLLFIPYVNIYFKSLIILYYSFCILIKSYYTIIGSIKNNDIKKFNKKTSIRIDKLKKYTILVPMFKENKKTIIQLLNSINNIDYPKYLLDVKLVLEEDDKNTKNILKNIDLPDYITKIWVPYFEPRTKPKACNVASLFAEGEILVIFDADDIPDKRQLIEANNIFFQTDNCNILQGCLMFYNYNQNLLTEFFNIEYTVWFKIILKIFSSNKITIPLGGTTNHIKYSFLEKYNFWDSYNVTEDLELSVIANKNNVEIGHLNSNTKEWCVVDVKSFIKQRTRWLKGYLLTYLIHFFNFKSLKTLNNFIFAHIIVGYTSLSFLLLPFLFISLYINDNIILITFWSICNAIYYITYCFIYFFILKTAKISFNFRRLVIFILYPFYFILHTISAWIAFFEIFYKPFYWSKTDHLNK